MDESRLLLLWTQAELILSLFWILPLGFILGVISFILTHKLRSVAGTDSPPVVLRMLVYALGAVFGHFVNAPFLILT